MFFIGVHLQHHIISFLIYSHTSHFHTLSSGTLTAPVESVRVGFGVWSLKIRLLYE